MNELPRIVREQCEYRGSERDSVIKTRIKATKIRAREQAARIGIRRQHISEIYAPFYFNPFMEAPCNPPQRAANNWQDALFQSHYDDPIGMYAMIIRDKDYLDQLEKK